MHVICIAIHSSTEPCEGVDGSESWSDDELSSSVSLQLMVDVSRDSSRSEEVCRVTAGVVATSDAVPCMQLDVNF